MNEFAVGIFYVCPIIIALIQPKSLKYYSLLLWHRDCMIGREQLRLRCSLRDQKIARVLSLTKFERD
jgi:hypothetical protein